MTSVGFTGTRHGMTNAQRDAVAELLCQLALVTEAHHGDCVGADAQFHNICIGAGIPVIGHPPSDPRLRASMPFFTALRPEKPYLDRNRDIVDESDYVIAAPHTTKDERGGTWHTIRYARKVGKPLAIVSSDDNRFFFHWKR